MTMIYFGGKFVGEDANGNPYMILGFDKAGNQLSAIYCSERIRFTRIEETSRNYREYYYLGEFITLYSIYGTVDYDGFDSTGKNTTTTRTLIAESRISYDDAINNITSFYAHIPRKIIARENGLIYSCNKLYNSLIFEWFRVYRRNGDRFDFPQLHGAEIFDFVFDADDNIYIVGMRHYQDHAIMRKYDKNGNLLWSLIEEGANNEELAEIFIGDGGDILKCAATGILLGDDCFYLSVGFEIEHEGYPEFPYQKSFVRKYTLTGEKIWDKSVLLSTFDFYYGVATLSLITTSNSDEFIYLNSVDHTASYKIKKLTGEFDKDLDVLHYDANNAFMFKPFGSNLVGLGCFLSNQFEGNNKIVINANDFTKTYSQLVCEGYLQPVNDFAIDTDGMLYIAFFGTDAFFRDEWPSGIFACDQNGISAWSHISPIHSPPWLISSVSIVHDTCIPSLALPFAIAPFQWIGDTYTAAAGLALRIGTGIPTWRREYVSNVRLPDTYRLIITGVPEVAIPVATIQIRRNATATTLTITSPAASSYLISTLLARSTEQLVLFRGVRFADGTTQIEEMLRVTMGSFGYDIGAQSGSISLTGSQAAVVGTSRERTLKGISYRAMNGDSARVRCAVDTFLAPGDIALLGNGESMIVGELVYSIAPLQAAMEVVAG